MNEKGIPSRVQEGEEGISNFVLVAASGGTTPLHAGGSVFMLIGRGGKWWKIIPKPRYFLDMGFSVSALWTFWSA